MRSAKALRRADYGTAGGVELVSLAQVVPLQAQMCFAALLVSAQMVNRFAQRLKVMVRCAMQVADQGLQLLWLKS